MCKFCYQAQRQGGMFPDDDPLFHHDEFDSLAFGDGGDNMQAQLAKSKSSAYPNSAAALSSATQPPVVPVKQPPSVPDLFGAARSNKKQSTSSSGTALIVGSTGKPKKKPASKKKRLAKTRAIRAQVEQMLETLYNIQDPTLSISEVHCLDPDCPDLELMIVVIATKGGEDMRFRVGVPMMECTADDIADAIRTVYTGTEYVGTHNKAKIDTPSGAAVNSTKQSINTTNQTKTLHHNEKTTETTNFAPAENSSWRLRKSMADEFDLGTW